MGAQDYSATVEITRSLREELQWHLSQWNGRTLVTQNPSVVTEIDASHKGWGATSQGIQTGGPWSKTESKMHINYLEALAAFLAVKYFVKELPICPVLHDLGLFVGNHVLHPWQVFGYHGYVPL